MHFFTYITHAAHTIRDEDIKKMIRERSALISFACVSYQRIARTLHIVLEMCAYHMQTLCRHACDENGLHYNGRHGWLSRVDSAAFQYTAYNVVRMVGYAHSFFFFQVTSQQTCLRLCPALVIAFHKLKLCEVQRRSYTPEATIAQRT